MESPVSQLLSTFFAPLTALMSGNIYFVLYIILCCGRLQNKLYDQHVNYSINVFKKYLKY